MTRPVETPVQARCEMCLGTGVIVEDVGAGYRVYPNVRCPLCSGTGFEPSSPPREKEKS